MNKCKTGIYETPGWDGTFSLPVPPILQGSIHESFDGRQRGKRRGEERERKKGETLLPRIRPGSPGSLYSNG